MSEPSSGRDEPINPYAPPQAPIGPAPVAVCDDLARAEAIRRAHLNHEANIKSVGQLHMLAAVLSAVGFVATLASRTKGGGANWAGLLVFVVPVAVNAALGYGLFKLQTWARWTETVLIGLGLVVLAAASVYSMNGGAFVGPMVVAFGIGGFIPGVVLWLLVSRQGTVVFSPEYRAIIARTPHVRYRTSCVAVVLAVLLLAFVLSGVVGLFFRR